MIKGSRLAITIKISALSHVNRNGLDKMVKRVWNIKDIGIALIAHLA